MTTNRVPHGSEPTAPSLAQRVVITLLQHGRWGDAATCYPAVEDPAGDVHATLLLAAGRVAEAGVVLAAATESEGSQSAFVRRAHAVLTGDRSGFPQLVASASAPEMKADPLANLVVMRAAQAVGQRAVAAHYANNLLSVAPGDVEASTVVVTDLVATGAYVEAVHAVDHADAWHCDDEPRPLDRALEAIESFGDVPKATALAVIGDYMHREADPTVPLTAAAQASRDRWRSARRQRTPRVPPDWLALFATVGVVSAIGFTLTGNALPGVVCMVLAGGWLNRRPIRGVDPASSQVVRALRNPMTRLSHRLYHVTDVITFVLTLFATISLVSTLPLATSVGVPLALFGGVVVAAGATRGRRRWVRRQRARLLQPALDPATCRCLDIDRLHTGTAQPYVEAHLFPVRPVECLPGWQLMQCSETYTYFLSCSRAGLTVALSA